MALKGLVIRQPWIGMILRGEKTWEMRSQPCRHRGPLALIEKGSGTVVAVAVMTDDLAPLSEAELRSSIVKHGIPAAEIPDAIRRGWVRPWVFADVTRLSRPVPYDHTSGGSWVNLTDAEEAAVLSAARGRVVSSLASPMAQQAYVRPAIEPSGLRSASAINGKPAQARAQADISSSIRQKGSKLIIDVAWKDEVPWRKKAGSSSGWFEAAGLIAAFIAILCAVGFVIHFVLGMISGSVSALSAFEWLIPMIIFQIVATLLGQGDLFDGFSGKR